jgi:hypothetical protein
MLNTPSLTTMTSANGAAQPAALRSQPDKPRVASPAGFALLAFIVAWALAVGWASTSGWLSQMAMPYFALLVALGIAAPTGIYFAAPPVRRWIEARGLYPLTLLHLWRIPAALMFFWSGAAGSLPTMFWLLAGTGDLLAGALAATIYRRRQDLTAYWRIHLFGFADFVVAVGTGLTFTLLGDPRMVTLTTLPMALIPLFGVGLSGASHLIAFDMLRRGRGLN